VIVSRTRCWKEPFSEKISLSKGTLVVLIATYFWNFYCTTVDFMINDVATVVMVNVCATLPMESTTASMKFLSPQLLAFPLTLWTEPLALVEQPCQQEPT
jgi:fucose 4-O-acetylase-like acetyltransferase